MRQAVRLARLGLGHTAPNPAVGCVIVKDGQARRPACGARWSLSPVFLAVAVSVFATAPSQSVCEVGLEGLSVLGF